MDIIIRAYKRTDPDIVGIYLNKEYDLFEVMKQVLCGYVRGQKVSVLYPAVFYSEDKFPRVVQGHIVLDSKKDADVIEWLKQLRPMMRNNFIKNLFRQSLSYFPSYAYYKKDTGMEQFIKTLNDSKVASPMEITSCRNRTKSREKQTDTRTVEEIKTKIFKEPIPEIGAVSKTEKTAEKKTEMIPHQIPQENAIPDKDAAEALIKNKPAPLPAIDADAVGADENEEDDFFSSFEQMMNQF